MLDREGRSIEYLRLSITDRCNCRCVYCMPEGGVPMLAHDQILSFEELARIIDGVEHDELLGVCLDTCHVWDGGYDVVGDLDGVLDEFDRVIGLDRLRALHLNDSKNPRGSHKDRHERIGEGCIGAEAFRAVVTNPRLRDLPMILETPNELSGYAAEISLLRGFAGEGEARG